MVSALLKANLHGLIPGVRAEIREALEGAIELGIRTEEVDRGDGRQVVGRRRFVEGRGGSLEIRQEWVRDRAEKVVADVVAVRIVRRIHLRDEAGEHVGRNEVAIAGAGVAAPWQMAAAIGRIIDADGDLSGEQALDADVPLVDVGVAGFFGAEVVAVVVPPQSERTVFVALRLCDTERKRIGERGELRGEVVIGEEDGIGSAEGGAGILEVGGRAKAVVDARAAPDDGFLIERPSEAYARRPVVAIGGNAATESALVDEEGGAVDRSRRLTRNQNDGLTGAAGKIAELLRVVALGVGRTPFVTQTEIDGEFGSDLPVVLDVESGFHGFVGDAGKNAEAAGIAKAGEECGEGISLRGVAALRKFSGDVLCEMEAAGRIGRLIKVVEEFALLEADFEGVTILDEGNCR